MKNFTRIILLVLLAIYAISCADQKSKQPQSDPQAFQDQVRQHTSGVISSGATLSVTLAREASAFHPGEELPSGIFEMEPKTNGKAYLVDPFHVEFRPDEPLKNGRQYLVKFDVDELLDSKDKTGIFSFVVNVIEQDFVVYPGQLISGGTPENPAKKYQGKMVTADEMSEDDVSKILSASIPGKSLPVKVTAAGAQEFNYLIQGIPRKESSYELTLYWTGDAVGVEKSGDLKIEIPGIDEFKILQVNADQRDASQNISLEFSDPVDPEQNLDGLISIKGFENFRLSLKGNTITLYPQERLLGEKTVVIDQSLRNIRGTKLNQSAEYTLAMEALKPEVIILGNGVIMPDSDGLTLPFKAVSLRAVEVLVYKIYADNLMQFFQNNNYRSDNQMRWVGRPVFRKMVRLDENPSTNLQQWNAFSVDLTGLFDQDKNAMYRVTISFRQEFSVYDCDQTPVDLADFADEPLMSEAKESYFNGGSGYYYEWPEDYSWRERDNPCSSSYYLPSRFPERNLLASNLGLIAKSADGKNFTVAVTDLLTTQPVMSAEIAFYNLQQQKIGSGFTGADGMAVVSLDAVPYILMVKHEGQQAWLRVDDGSSLSMSNFDVSGQKISKGIKGMIYGERGVWRPGDTLFLTFVMDDVTGKLPKDHPVVFELINSRGQLAKREVKTSGINGFYVFKPVTDPDDPTGKWTARVKVGGASFSKLLNIETIKPNRLKINLNFNREIITKNDPEQKASLDVKWLHGADAANLKARVNVTLYGSDYGFDAFEAYTFQDASKNFYPSDNTVFDGTLDASGKASFPLEMYVNYGAPGMLRAVFNTRVFEEGGDFSTDVFSKPYAPYNRFVGIHVPEGGDYKNMLATDTSHTVEVVTVNQDGKPVTVNNLDVRIYKVNWRWWWSSGSDNLASWIRGQDSDVVFAKTISTKNGYGSFDFKIEYPAWGRYFIQITDRDGGHSSGMPVYIDWPSYISRKDRTNPSGATILSVTADKEKYQPGEQATLTFPVAKNSKALISLETGSEVLKYWWVHARDVQNGFSFEVTGEMAPNVFAYVTVVQPHAQTINDLPIRMYGVVPVSVEDPETILKPEIRAPMEIRPESMWEFSISESEGKPMTYTVAVVDEGLLDLTRFKTPDLWQNFYAREALGVKTWDLFDEVLGAYGGKLQKVLAIGGDDAVKVDENKKPNRFEPVVDFLGPFTLRKNKTDRHTLKMSNYVGSVKIMVVAGRDGAYGSADTTVPVKQPLMVLPTAPRVIGPGEEFSLPISVFVMKEGIKNVKLKVAAEGPLQVSGTEDYKISFEKMGEQMAYFKLTSDSIEGNAEITVTATSGRESASATINLEVKNPNEYISRVETIVMKEGESKTINYDFFGTEGTNSGTIEVSAMPSFNLEKNMQHLIRYPYGCVEQITSAAFPQLYLDDLTDLSAKQKTQIHNNITKAIRKLRQFQISNGAMSYWPGRSYASSWGSSYAWHFLLMAEQKGYLVPSGFKKRWQDWQYAMASDFEYKSGYNYYWHNELSQAYRLYTLALSGKPNLSAMNRMKEQEGLRPIAMWRLAAAYLLAGMPEAAEDITQGLSYTETEDYNYPGITFGSSIRDMAMILETLVLMEKEEQAFELATVLAERLSTDYLSTQTAAFGLYAMAQFAASAGTNNDNHFAFEIAGKREKVNSKMPVYSIDVMDQKSKSITLENLAGNNLYITKTISGKPLQDNLQNESKNLEMTVKYLSIDGKPLTISQLKQGTDFEAVVTVKNPGLMGDYQTLALAQVFPSGWEILNVRYTEAGETSDNDSYDYQDIRDDRVYTFLGLRANASATFKISLNAAYAGKYYIPGTVCHDMYDNRIYARKKGQVVEVVK